MSKAYYALTAPMEETIDTKILDAIKNTNYVGVNPDFPLTHILFETISDRNEAYRALKPLIPGLAYNTQQAYLD